MALARGRRARRASPLRRHQAQSQRLGHDRAGRGDEQQTWPDAARLIEVTLDEASIGRNNAEVEHEREVAIFDLLERNSFALEGHERGPYTLHLSLADNRLVFTVGDSERAPIQHVTLSLSPFRRMVKDYFLVCESYYQAIKTAAAPPRSRPSTWAGAACTTKGAACCMERLKGKIAVDIATARRLFTLLCALHWKG